MGGNSRRAYGGAGFAIDGVPLTVTVRSAAALTIKDLRNRPMTPDGIRRLRTALTNACNHLGVSNSVSIEITGLAGANCGFGTGTAIRLSCLDGALSMAGAQEELSRLIELSGRGRTSGVGIQTYFHGGLSLDCGVAAAKGVDLVPSSESEFLRPVVQPLARLQMPSWPLGIFMVDSEVIQGSDEVAFFKENRRIPKSEIDELCCELFLNLPGAILDGDIIEFSKTLNRIQDIGFKALEWRRLGDEAKKASNWLYDQGALAVALSSMGPAIVAVFKEEADAQQAVSSFRKGFNASHLAKPRPEGRRLRAWR